MSSIPESVDLAVIGAGVVGLAIARQWVSEHPRDRVVVFDKEPHLARHASGRNSGVIHAGFYYAPDSLKARLTRRGTVLLHRFCDEHRVPVRRCGKVVVARDTTDLPRLDELLRRAGANDVPVEMVDEAGLADLEPMARTTQRALWSPTTSVADPTTAVEALAEDSWRKGVRILLNAPVTDARPGSVTVAGTTWSCGHIVNCAGLQADLIARRFGMCDDYVIIPFKGLYRYGNWPQGRLHRLVYPTPDPRNPFLGVHATVTVEGRVKIGPTAVPALSREHYRLRDLRPRETPGVLHGLSRFLRSTGHDGPALVTGEVRKYSAHALAHDAAELVPTIRARDFREVGRPGIRAQLVRKADGGLEMDFVLRGDRQSTHVLNAVSPAWTSALAVAEHVTADIRARV